MALGISIYPDMTTFEEDKAYLDMAKQIGYKRVFMSFLQINIKDPKASIAKIQRSSRYAHSIGFEVTLDIHPLVFKFLPQKEDDLSFFHEMGVDVLRLDSGYDGQTEAMMTRNPYNIKIEINMSNDTNMLARILDYHPDRTRLQGSHNFYPQRWTGISYSLFERCSQRFLQERLHSAAFVFSQQVNITPWPVSEGMCTLEMDRDLPLVTQVRHMKMTNLLDDILISNAYVKEAELREAYLAYQEDVDTLHVEWNEQTTKQEKDLILNHLHEYRGDTSEYVIRSSKLRMKMSKEALPPHAQSTDIKVGDILVLNESYGQYKGEIQIAKVARSADARINVVGSIKAGELCLMELLKPFQKFYLQEARL